MAGRSIRREIDNPEFRLPGTREMLHVVLVFTVVLNIFKPQNRR
jgi:hypothetical protein